MLSETCTIHKTKYDFEKASSHITGIIMVLKPSLALKHKKPLTTTVPRILFGNASSNSIQSLPLEVFLSRKNQEKQTCLLSP